MFILLILNESINLLLDYLSAFQHVKILKNNNTHYVPDTVLNV